MRKMSAPTPLGETVNDMFADEMAPRLSLAVNVTLYFPGVDGMHVRAVVLLLAQLEGNPKYLSVVQPAPPVKDALMMNSVPAGTEPGYAEKLATRSDGKTSSAPKATRTSPIESEVVALIKKTPEVVALQTA